MPQDAGHTFCWCAIMYVLQLCMCEDKAKRYVSHISQHNNVDWYDSDISVNFSVDWYVNWKVDISVQLLDKVQLLDNPWNKLKLPISTSKVEKEDLCAVLAWGNEG